MAFPVPLGQELTEAVNRDLPPPDYHVSPPKLTIWQILLGQNPEKHREKAKFMLNGAAAGMGRQPTQLEADALSEIIYKESRTISYMLPAALALAGILSWQSRASYKFPFYQPKFIKFNPNVFPHAGRPFVQGIQANLIWHNTRFFCYGIVSALFTGPVLASYGTSVAIASAARDDRLSQFRKDMQPARLISMTADQIPLSNLRAQRSKVSNTISKMEEDLRLKKRMLSMANTEKLAQDYTSQIEYVESRMREYKTFLGELDAAISRRSGQTGEGDDMSQDQQAYASLGASSSAEYQVQEPQSSSRPVYTTQSETPSSQNGWGQQSTTPGWGKADASDGLDIDDASPIAPEARSAPQSSSPTGTGSAWDRLRQSSQRQQRPSGNTWEGSQGQRGQSGDSDVSSEKDKAQRQFDEMLERERRTDDQGSGRNSRW
ncbi:hypothetical protein CkaCkLH20_06489 [Colletotrichum karsti]|uniref:Uncharacterized protein n=1 Tax=Colletotrichum karsti TaxID=1095194 RepID=A0A9P6LJV2_9PEZI|nr:uncharacterized protein CkaCkLH20_06489 [Colletotrichum karsti]KAF9876043.1 hypothetical protein CkaCkLH20_06489 [Colletotrichum karsti]